MNELPRKVMTVCIIVHDGRVLLGMKKKGLGTGRYNGFGGKVEPGETIEEAARREVKEEAGLEVNTLHKVGLCEFHSPVRPFVVEMHIFTANNFSGMPQESDEMCPEWFKVDEWPYEHCWPSDRLWMPYFLEGKKFKARFVFDENDSVLEHEILTE